ncbi:MAG: serine hydrolase [Chlamydiae bacterium]|nr:serine hydrolase [Chlamydiota bacterium]
MIFFSICSLNFFDSSGLKYPPNDQGSLGSEAVCPVVSSVEKGAGFEDGLLLEEEVKELLGFIGLLSDIYVTILIVQHFRAFMNTKIFFTLLTALSLHVYGSEEKINEIVNETIKTFEIPGAAISVVKDGKIILNKGYGVRSLLSSKSVDELTVFPIASCTKAFTAMALGILVDKELIEWDDKVIEHIPEFRLHDVHATYYSTIRDLLCHMSGLPRHEIMWYYSTFPRSEILNKLPGLSLTKDLRARFQYNNLMYAVLGILIEKVSGKTWEQYISENIFRTLKMKRSFFSYQEAQKMGNVVSAHTKIHTKVQQSQFVDSTNMGPAISIHTCASDMSKWMLLQLNDGKYQDKQIVEMQTLSEMHSVQAALQNIYYERSPYIFGYGLGWFTGIYDGNYILMHGGTVHGALSYLVLIPKENLGVMVMINSDHENYVPERLAYAICDIMMQKEPDWRQELEKKKEQIQSDVSITYSDESSEELPALLCPVENYLGRYSNSGYGDVKIEEKANGMILTYNGQSYQLKHKGYNHFMAQSTTKNDLWIHCWFYTDSNGKISDCFLGLEPQLWLIAFSKKSDST